MTARRGLLVLAVALVLIALTVARPSSTSGPLLRDFEAYWSAGQTYDAGGDPYGRGIWQAERDTPGVDPNRDEILPFISPPPTLPQWAAIARLTYAAASRLWWFVLVSALVGLIVFSLRGSGGRITVVSFLAALALAIGFGPITGDLALGQIAIVAFSGALFTSTAPSGIVKTIGAFVAFFQPNVAIGLASQIGRNRTTVAVVSGGVLSYVVGALVAGWSWPVQYLRLVRSHEGGEQFSAIQLTPAAIAHGFSLSPQASAIVAVVVAVAAILIAISITRRVAGPFARFAAVSPLGPFVATFFHEHDLIVAFPAAIFCALHARGPARVLGLAGTMLVAIDWVGLAQRPNAIAQSAFLAAAAFLAFVALGDDLEVRAIWRAALPAAVLFTAGAFAGAAHPMPVWPDHLGNFHASAGAPLAAVWQQEQRIDGLLAVDPAWSALRLLSLLGCALLPVAVVRSRR